MPDNKPTKEEAAKNFEREVRGLEKMSQADLGTITDSLVDKPSRSDPVAGEEDRDAAIARAPAQVREQPAGDDVSSQIVQVLQEIKGAIESLPDDIVQRLEG